MKKNILTIFSLFSFLPTFAQTTQWERKIENEKQDYLTNVISTIDQQYLISGSSNNKDRNFDYHVLKLNQQGVTVWEKFFGGDKNDFLNTSISLSDGGFFLVGSSNSNKSFDKISENIGSSDTWLLRIDEYGNEVWQKSLGTKYKEEVKKIIETTQSNLILALDTKIELSQQEKNNLQLIKLDSKGNFLKDSFISINGQDNIETLIATEDGGVIMGVYTRSDKKSDNIFEGTIQLDSLENNYRNSKNNSTVFYKTDSHYGEGDFWVLKFDSELNLEWQRTFGGDKDDHIRNITKAENGFMILGESNSNISGNKKTENENFTDLWLIKIDEQGNEVWQKNYDFGKIDIPMSLDIIRNHKTSTIKGHLIGGFSQQDTKLEKNDEKFWMLYLDNDGEEVWRKYIDKKDKSINRLVSAKFSNDSYILAGTTAEEVGFEDWSILKLKDKDLSDLIEKEDFKIYPVPTSTYLYVDLNLNFETANISIFDFAGTLIQQQVTKNKITKLNTSSLIGGVYILKVETDTNQSFNQKFIKK